MIEQHCLRVILFPEASITSPSGVYSRRVEINESFVNLLQRISKAQKIMTWTRPQRDLPSVSKYVKDFTLHVNVDTDYDDDIDHDEISQKFGRSKIFQLS